MNTQTLIRRLHESMPGIAYTIRNDIIQNFAHILEEHHGVSRVELRVALSDMGYILEEFCIGCKEPIPAVRILYGNPICNECREDVDSVS